MNKKNIIVIFGLIVLAIALRSFNLDRGFEGDEAITLRSAATAFADIVPSLIRYDSHPPLTAILLHFWMNISKNEIFIRYYFVIFGMFTLLITALIAYEYFNRNAKIALLALFLGSISPLLISLSQFSRNYIDSAFWVLLSNYFLLLILKDKGGKISWLGYVLSAVLGIYTFYFSMVIIVCQNIYILVFKLKEREFLGKWIFSQAVIALLFSPWLPYFFTQIFNSSSSMSLHWERVGFKVAGIGLGRYARNIGSLLGLDYFFMSYPEGIVKHFSMPLLLGMASMIFTVFLMFLFYTLRQLKREFNSGREMWFVLSLSFLPLIVSWFTAKGLKILPYARYLAAPHAMFLILISYFFYTLISKHKKIGIPLFCLFIFLYALRLPASVTPPYEGKKALQYLKEYIQAGDCTVMAGDSLPGRENLPVPAFDIGGNIFETDPLTSEKRPLSESKSDKIKNSLRPFKRIWLITCPGNNEIFGGNKIVYDFLIQCGRGKIAEKEFHNYKLILME